MPDPDAGIFRLIYASRRTRECGPKDLEDILASSRKNNETVDITGALCYSPVGFLQCMEGPRSAVNELYRRIVQDSRNRDVTVITAETAARRFFKGWSMAYVRADEVDRAIMDKHGITLPFDPYRLTAKQAGGMLRDTARERAAFLARHRGA